MCFANDTLSLQCLTLGNKYKRGKLLAYQLLCQMMIRQPDMTIPQDLLTKFYHVLHQGLTSQDQVGDCSTSQWLISYCVTLPFCIYLRLTINFNKCCTVSIVNSFHR